MTSQRREFIEVPVIEGTRTTIPVDEAKRLAAAEIKIEPAEEEDALEIVSRFSTYLSPLHANPTSG